MQPPRPLAGGFEVLGVDAYRDPMDPAARPPGEPALPGVALPADHAAVVGDRSSSFSLGPWKVLVPGEVWRLSVPGGSFVVLAEREADEAATASRLCLREEDARLVFVDDHGEVLAEAEGSLDAALRADVP